MKLTDARALVTVTDQQREWAAEIKANGGTYTAEEMAWLSVWDYVGNSWTGPRARQWAATEEAKTGIPHVGTPDGRLWRLRA